MSLKNAIRALTGLTLATLGTGATLAYFEESIPMSLNPLYAKTMADYRATELIFDRLWFHDAITNELRVWSHANLVEEEVFPGLTRSLPGRVSFDELRHSLGQGEVAMPGIVVSLFYPQQLWDDSHHLVLYPWSCVSQDVHVLIQDAS